MPKDGEFLLSLGQRAWGGRVFMARDGRGRVLSLDSGIRGLPEAMDLCVRVCVFQTDDSYYAQDSLTYGDLQPWRWPGLGCLSSG